MGLIKLFVVILGRGNPRLIAENIVHKVYVFVKKHEELFQNYRQNFIYLYEGVNKKVLSLRHFPHSDSTMLHT